MLKMCGVMRRKKEKKMDDYNEKLYNFYVKVHIYRICILFLSVKKLIYVVLLYFNILMISI